jgi:hypothetical protein
MKTKILFIALFAGIICLSFKPLKDTYTHWDKVFDQDKGNNGITLKLDKCRDYKTTVIIISNATKKVSFYAKYMMSNGKEVSLTDSKEIDSGEGSKRISFSGSDIPNNGVLKVEVSVKAYSNGTRFKLVAASSDK